MRPLIAIAGELVVTDVKPPRSEVRLSQRYVAAVERAGGLPLVVGYGSQEHLAELVERVDGLVFSGGDDFDLARMGLGPTHAAAKPVPGHKQDFDLALARLALASGLPVLGICYGMQLLALSEGGSLHQHLPDDRPGAQPHAGGIEHAVRLLAGTKLRACAGVPTLAVISRHHQAVAGVVPPWRVAGVDEEDLIEGIERLDHPFALGVQWHPELSGAPEHARLFAALVAAARGRAEARTGLARGQAVEPVHPSLR
jgi:putative glutamine amidotransferase